MRKRGNRAAALSDVAEEHGSGTESDPLAHRLIDAPHGRGKLLRVPRGGKSPNPSGQSKVKMLTAALEKRLKDNAHLADDIAGWWLKMIENGDSTALKEALVRLEGHVPREAQRELPTITLNLQSVQNVQANHGQPVSLPGRPSPALHGTEVRASGAVELKPFTPPEVDEDEGDEESDG